MKVYINDFTGLCNKFEALILAFSIREYFGHEIWLDWPELDSLNIASTRRGRRGILSKLNSIKMRDCDFTTFSSLYKYRNIHLRGLRGAHPESLDRQLPKVIDCIRIKPDLIFAIKKFYSEINKPVIGVHIRRGDFVTASSLSDFDKNSHSAIPDSWLVKSFELLRAKFPDVNFYLSFTGKSSDYKCLLDKFPCHTLDIKSPYGYKGPGHSSDIHPVADLFALACCDTIIGSPGSSFSHWAANCLGNQSTIVTPKPVNGSFENIALTARKFGLCRMHVWGSYDWLHSADSIDELPHPGFPSVDWL